MPDAPIPDQWWLWLDSAHSPAINMSIDEQLLKTAQQAKRPVLRIYQWDRPAVSIGFVQAYDAAPQTTYTIVRRPTGGGVVFHDCDLTYSVIIPVGHHIYALDRTESYREIHNAVKAAFGALGLNTTLTSAEIPKHVDRAFMQCFTTPTRYDVVADGKKFAGSAQRRTRDGILHQGSIDLNAAGGDRELLTKNLIEAFRSQLNIAFADFTISPDFLESAKKLSAKKYAAEAWNIHRQTAEK